MLSRKPRRQDRMSTGKMYDFQLPLGYSKLVNCTSDKIQADCDASLPHAQPRVDESYLSIASKGFSSSLENSHKRRGRTYPCDLHGSLVKQNKNEVANEFIMDNSSSNLSSSKQNYHNRVQGTSKVKRCKNYTWNGCGIWLLCFLNLFFMCGTCQADSNQCAPGINTPGRTWPPGDIILEHGESLKIYCMLNESGMDSKFHSKNSSDLVFFRNKKEMQPEYVRIINETTLVLYVEKPAPSKDMYYCKLRLDDTDNKQFETVCLNNVVIGFKPMEPTKFDCVSKNWENLTCTWEPAQNYITTNFSLSFKLPGRVGGRQRYSCPVHDPEVKLPPNTCLWNAASDPPYRLVYDYYTFILSAENILGTANFSYRFHHWAHVIPSKPADLTLVNKTYSSVLLHWKVPYPMQNFPPGLHHRVSYQHQWDSRKTWETRNINTDLHVSEKYFNLTDLQYANTVYDVRIYIKSAVAIGEDKWSQPSDITIKTAATLPGLPPRTDIGSFEIAGSRDHRDVYIYWQTIPTYLENGDNFTYQVVNVEESGKKVDFQPNESTKTYAKFKGLSSNNFRFEIVTTNCKGANKHKAVVYVPSESEMPREPVAFTKIAFDGGLYELSWNPPSNANITNYTIFWCENDRDRPYQCSGYLDWVHVPCNTSVFNVTVPEPEKVYQFAIAANTARASSGMVWASCTAIHNKAIGKMKSVWINHIESDLIEVGWKLECSDRIDIIQGFNIYYCPITSPHNVTCKGPKMNTTVKAHPNTMHGVVYGLTPYTTYMLTVAVLTKNGEGAHSDPLYNTTLEGPPTPPQNVIVTDVTNTSMTVEWQPPAAMNGILNYYLVYYNEKWINVEKERKAVIRYLEAHKGYNISVSACTVRCSNRSVPIFRKTNIGVPGEIEVPVVRFVNHSQVNIVWKPPKDPGGHLDYYEVLTGDGYIHTNITATDKLIGIPDCNTAGHEKLNRFQVRAVNLGPDKTRFLGPWSEPGEGNCFSNGPSSAVWVLIWFIISFSVVAFFMFLGYSSKRLWIKCKAMQDVEVKLPPGLAPNVKLLDKQHIQQHSPDSSGCSSGQESVTSSLTPESHASTDSGADLDPVPMSPTKLLESPPAWVESSRLRQRNVAGTKLDSCIDRDRWDSYVKVAPPKDTSTADSLSLARSTPNLLSDSGVITTAPGMYTPPQQHAWSSTGYISMPSSEGDSSSNPSPVPRGKSSTEGVYSVVGLPPSSMPRARPTADGRGIERSHPHTANLIPLGTEASQMIAGTVNPYVSLASLEQKTRNSSPLHIPSLGDLGDIDFVHSLCEEEEEEEEEDEDNEQQRQQQQPFSISDKLSKPYVQTGLMDVMREIRPSNNPDNPDEQKGLYVPRRKNPYVAVATMASMMDAPLCSDYGRTDSVHDQSPSYPFSSQLPEPSCPTTHKSGDYDDPITRPTALAAGSLPVIKQTSGYVTIAENPTRPNENSSLPYVPHQRVDKKSSPTSQQNVGQADEQYSKVTVVPTTT